MNPIVELLFEIGAFFAVLYFCEWLYNHRPRQ
jgi:hypothetical protein